MAHFHINQRAFRSGRRRVLAPPGAAQPGQRGVVAGVVAKHPLDDQNLFATRMPVRTKTGVGRPSNQGCADAVVLMQRHDLQARHHALPPGQGASVKANRLLVLRGKLPQLDEDHTAVTRKWSMRRARRIAQIGACGVVAAFIGKDAFKHQDFFTAAMHMPGKAGARQVAHDAGGPRNFRANAVQHASLNAGQRRWEPFGASSTRDDALREVVIQILSGELHLTILLETMRREGYELAVSRPRVLFKEINGEKCEPYELLTVDIENEHQGGVMEELGRRRGDLQNMESDSKGRVRLEYRIPARGLIGFQGEFLTLTRGTGLASHIFDDYGPMAGVMAERRNGVLISQDDGAAVAYALWKLQDRGRMFVSPGDPLYEGIIIGIHSRDNDLVVNPIKGKQLTNVRSSGTDEAVRLITPIQVSLESAVEFIADDELVEITPKSIRIRKRFLKEHDRKRAGRSDAA